MVCTKKPLLVLIVESRGFFGSANNASCLDNAFVSLHLRIPPRVLHFSAFIPLVFHNLPSLYPPSFSIYSSVQFEQIIVDVRNIDMFLTLQL